MKILEERANELEDTSIEIIQSEQEKEIRFLKMNTATDICRTRAKGLTFMLSESQNERKKQKNFEETKVELNW